MSAYIDEYTIYFSVCEEDGPACSSLADQEFETQGEAEEAAEEHNRDHHS